MAKGGSLKSVAKATAKKGVRRGRAVAKRAATKRRTVEGRLRSKLNNLFSPRGEHREYLERLKRRDKFMAKRKKSFYKQNPMKGGPRQRFQNYRRANQYADDMQRFLLDLNKQPSQRLLKSEKWARYYQ